MSQEHRNPLLKYDEESSGIGENSSSSSSPSPLRGKTSSFEVLSGHKNDRNIKLNSNSYDADVEAPPVDKIPEKEFEYSSGLSTAEAARRLALYGPNRLPEVIISKWYIFVQQLWQPMPVMIWIAVIIEAALDHPDDCAVLLFIQFFNATLGYKEITSAGDAVAALKKTLQARAEVFRDGRWWPVSAEDVVPGDMIKLASGSAVPADCRLNEGQIDVDQSAMTGESLPVSMYKGDKAIMGSTVSRGETEATVEFTGANTVYGKTAKLLAASTEHSNLQKLLIKIVSILVVVCFVLCTTVLIYLVDLTGSVPEAISYAVVLMVASIPMAIEIVTTTTLALGSKELVSHGAIVTRLSAIEDMAGMSILCSDKTGTLTKNVMELQEHTPVYSPGETQYTLLRYAAMAAKWKEEARDALDRLTLGCVDMKSLDSVVQTAYMPFDPIVKRTEGIVIENGTTFKTTKGAPNIILALCVDADNGASAASVADQVNEDVRKLGERGIRSLAVAKTNAQGKWTMLGLLTFLDPPREDTAQTIVEAVNYGVAVKMITGDHLLIAKEMAKRLNLGGFILPADNLPMLGSEDKRKPDKLSENYGDQCLSADGFAGVFPEHKYLIVECLREMGYKVGMTGDGVNDAPALKCADVGVAVCGATDAARSAADIVLTTEGLSTIVHGIFCARKIFKRISNFLTYRISATLQLLIFFFIAVFAFQPVKYMPKDWQTIPDFPDKYEWAPYFHMPVIMLILITLLNDFSLIAIGYDFVIPQQTPCVWNKQALFFISSILALVALVSSLILLEFCLNSWDTSGFFHNIGLGGLGMGQVTTSLYLKVSISDFLTLFSARTGGDWFWSQRPAPMLLGAACFALAISTILAVSWPASDPDGVRALGLGYRPPAALAVFIWFYCIFWWFIQDAAKVFAHRAMHRFNWFGVNDSGVMRLPVSALEYKRAVLAGQITFESIKSH